MNPLRVPDVGVASGILAPMLGLNAEELFGKLKLAQTLQRGFVWVKRRVTPAESARLRSLNLDWIEFRQESRRFSPTDS